ncbi:MAG: phosphatidylserine decarboxylase family protein [Phycisphaerae bacterium]|nr:phosphatidylserine decarboxylase family protein [Phycisphaerae bacterium]|tara:strand:+ start:276 stop:965 length:690 start_codon:yes stop_codon:yes gene_type:complete
MRLAHYGIREWGTAFGVFAAGVGIVLFIDPVLSIKLSILIPLGILMFAVMAFFRDPNRTVPADWSTEQMLSPADGVISSIESHEQHPDLGGPGIVIRIFLSVLDVHLNRWPCNGAVTLNRHVPGRHHDARSDRCHMENEHNLVLIRRDDDTIIGVRQIAGLIARRIVCPVDIDDRAEAGQRYGMIKFGSSTELILPTPEHVDVKVSKGDRVRAGETVLAVLPEANAIKP